MVKLGEEQQQTPAKRGKKPEWNHNFVFKNENHDSIELELWDKGIVASDSLLGVAKVSLKDKKDEAFWVPIHSPEGNYEGKIQLEWELDSLPLPDNQKKVINTPPVGKTAATFGPVPKLFANDAYASSATSFDSSRPTSNDSLEQSIVNDGSSQFLQASRPENNASGSSQYSRRRSRLSLTNPTLFTNDTRSVSQSTVSLEVPKTSISSGTLAKYGSLQRTKETITTPVNLYQPPPLPPRRNETQSQISSSSSHVAKYASLHGLAGAALTPQNLNPPGSPKRMHSQDRPGSPKRTHYALGSTEYLTADYRPSISSNYTSSNQFIHGKSSSNANSQSSVYSTGNSWNEPITSIYPNDSISTVGIRTKYSPMNPLPPTQQFTSPIYLTAIQNENHVGTYQTSSYSVPNAFNSAQVGYSQTASVEQNHSLNYSHYSSGNISASSSQEIYNQERNIRPSRAPPLPPK